MAKRKTSRPHSANKREAFLEALATGRTVGDAAKSVGVGVRTAYDWRKKDQTFADAWEEAYEQGADALLAEAQRRAIDGVTEPVFYLGKPVGHTRRYSDTLLIVLLKSRDPVRFCDRARTAALERKWAENLSDPSRFEISLSARQLLDRAAAEKASLAD